MPLKTGGARPICRLAVLAVLAIVTIGALAAAAPADAWAQGNLFGGIHPPAVHGVAGWLLAKQALFYRALARILRAAKTDGSAYWGLMGVSFLYGIFHAAGPGHGKAVISSYMLANEETWRRGVALSFAAALLQALTAIILVIVAAALIGTTAKMMGDAVRVIEECSYALIALLGARLLWVKGRALVHTWHAVRSSGGSAARERQDRARHNGRHDSLHGQAECDHHAHSLVRDADHPDHAHHHDQPTPHDHDHDEEDSVLPWGHAHGPEPEELAGPGGWSRGLSAVVAVGLRPCSGAIIILVFALAQGLFWAGIASTFVMGLGTAITVATIATLAVAAKATAKRFAAARPGYGSLILRGIEVGAAVLVIAFGVLLLTGYMASERMGMF